MTQYRNTLEIKDSRHSWSKLKTCTFSGDTKNKLVRDKVPQIIEENGGKCTTKKLNEEKFENALNFKLTEVVSDYVSSPGNVEKMAEIFEVVHNIMDCYDWTFDQIGQIQLDKEKEMGGFWERIMLVSVDYE